MLEHLIEGWFTGNFGRPIKKLNGYFKFVLIAITPAMVNCTYVIVVFRRLIVVFLLIAIAPTTIKKPKTTVASYTILL